VNESVVLDLMKETATVALALAAPALAVGLVVGILVALFQAVTSVQEQTLTLVPKLFAVVGVIMLVAPWMISTLVDFTRRMLALVAEQGG
jgi:flagellar biosynthetic protein FliQ